MNRCRSLFLPLHGMAVALAAWSLCAIVVPAGAQAQLAVRQFPAAALRGALTVTTPPEVLINGAAERLAPGVRIRGVNNLLVLSNSLVGQTYIVNYVRE